MLPVSALQVNAVLPPSNSNQWSQDVGLSARSVLLPSLQHSLNARNAPCTILEIAPENWCGMGGIKKQYLDELSVGFTWYCHGLSLSLGGLKPLDFTFLAAVKDFLNRYNVACYSEHLSFCSDQQGELYELFPLPFNSDTVLRVAKRIQTVQDYLQRRIVIENISYYMHLDNELTEAEFITAVIKEADCDLLLDVNNVYVNCMNHNGDAKQFIRTMPSERIAYFHVAGHQKQSLIDFDLSLNDADDSILIDTHHYPVPNPVWDLLQYAYTCHGVKTTVLECDNGIPAWSDLCVELQHIHTIMDNTYVY